MAGFEIEASCGAEHELGDLSSSVSSGTRRSMKWRKATGNAGLTPLGKRVFALAEVNVVGFEKVTTDVLEKMAMPAQGTYPSTSLLGLPRVWWPPHRAGLQY